MPVYEYNTEHSVVIYCTQYYTVLHSTTQYYTVLHRVLSVYEYTVHSAIKTKNMKIKI